MKTAVSRETRHRVASTTGLILVDSLGRPLYYNCEAMTVLTYARQGKKPENVEDLLLNELQMMLPYRGDATRDVSEFASGRRRYVCRLFALTSSAGKRSGGITAVLLERDSARVTSFSKIIERFHLTVREQEMVGLLTLGLTSKEIADRMNISPNTVKTFFRLVMTKMGVSTRAGIVGKIARA
jgi:DNA-binding CsgD family transcriptional regulator